MSDNKSQELYESFLNNGLALARSRRWAPLCEDLVGKHPERAALTATLLENQRKFFKSQIAEDVRTMNVGSFDRFAFPIIRAVYPNLVSADIVSVQPMQGPTSLIFYLDVQYSKAKGQIAAGSSALSPLTGHTANQNYGTEKVTNERIGTGDGADTTPLDTDAALAWVPVRPFSVTVVAGAAIATDDGNGNLTGSGISSGTINYTTGAISIAYSSAPANGAAILATYNYVSEGSDTRPELDILLTSAQIQAETHSLRTNWSVEAEQDFRAVHGIEAQTTLMSVVAEQLRFEIDRGTIDAIKSAAIDNGVVVQWDYTPPAGVPFYQHQLTFVNKLVEASNKIFQDTGGKAVGNFVVCGTNMATVVESLPSFIHADYGDAEGVVFIGTLGGVRFYKDPWYAADFGLMGYKGANWLKTGFVFAPYVPLWRTPVVTLTDIKRRVGMMSRYARKLVNQKMYIQLEVQNFGVLS